MAQPFPRSAGALAARSSAVTSASWWTWTALSRTWARRAWRSVSTTGDDSSSEDARTRRQASGAVPVASRRGPTSLSSAIESVRAGGASRQDPARTAATSRPRSTREGRQALAATYAGARPIAGAQTVEGCGGRTGRAEGLVRGPAARDARGRGFRRRGHQDRRDRGQQDCDPQPAGELAP